MEASTSITDTPAPTHAGRCLCGGIRYEVQGPLKPIQVCHCSMCRRAYGGPFATITPVPAANFRLLAGEDLVTFYESTPGKKRFFCRRCASPLYSRRDDKPELLRLRAGLLEIPLGVRPVVHFFMDSAADWWTVDDGLPQYPGNIPPEVRAGLNAPEAAERC